VTEFDPLAKFTVKVCVEDPATSVDLSAYLEQIANVKVHEHFAEILTNAPATLLYVVPEREYDDSKLFTAIEGMTEQWFNSRCDAVTVEIRKPDGHLQVLARERGRSRECA
jgi:hypothetical protein